MRKLQTSCKTAPFPLVTVEFNQTGCYIVSVIPVRLNNHASDYKYFEKRRKLYSYCKMRKHAVLYWCIYSIYYAKE